MSRGHSGTRLLARAIEALGVNLGDTNNPTADTQDRRFTRAIKRVAVHSIDFDPTIVPPEPYLVRRFAACVGRYRRGLGEAPGGWGWKFPETYLIPHVVHGVFPAAFHVHMVRDGRDIAFKRHLTDDPQRRLGRRLLRHINALRLPHHVQAAKSWEYQVLLYLEFMALFEPRVVTIRFEDLCREPHGTLGRIAAFLERPMTDACRRLLDQTVERSKVAQHDSEEPEAVAAVEAAIGPTLARLGYALNTATRSRQADALGDDALSCRADGARLS